MDLLSRRRWMLVLAQVVSCCVNEMSKSRDCAWRTITKFVWQLGRYEASSPVSCCAPRIAWNKYYCRILMWYMCSLVVNTSKYLNLLLNILVQISFQHRFDHESSMVWDTGSTICPSVVCLLLLYITYLFICTF